MFLYNLNRQYDYVFFCYMFRPTWIICKLNQTPKLIYVDSFSLYIYYTETQRDVCLEGHRVSSKAWEILVVKCRNCQIHLISNKKCYTLC